MASGMNNISSEFRRSELIDRELGTSAYADTNELIINSELEFDDQTEYRQSALQFEDHKEHGGFAQKPSEGLKIIIGTSVTFAVGITMALIISIYLGPPVTNSHGAVVSGSDKCLEMGVSILQLGGSAVDAAITTVFCEGVVRPHVTGIGGGGCLIIRKHAEKLTQVVNFREMIPAAFAASIQVGGQVAVPGFVKGLKEAHSLAGGRLPWNTLLKPVIELAREGFLVSQDLADAIKQLNTSGVKVSDGLSQMVYPGGQPLTQGQLMTRPDLACLLENIAANGSTPLYTAGGQLGQDIITTVTKAGGVMTMTDLTMFAAPVVSALKTTFYNLTVEVPAAPPGGALLVLALNIIQSFGFHAKNAAENITYHYIAESLAAALAQQYQWADMDSMASSNNITSILTSDQFAQKLHALISANTSQPWSHYGQDYAINTDATVSHVSVFGFNEDMVSVSTSLGSPFGSGLITDSGIILNNQMALFDTAGGSVKGKRVPLLTVPVVVHTPGRPCGARFALGSSPGPQAIASVVQTLTSVAVFGQGLNETVSQAHFCPHADTLQYEAGFKQDIVAFLENIGYTTKWVPAGSSTVDGVAKINETVSSVTDKHGVSVGVTF